MGVKVAVVNQKGGVGKTTLVRELGGALARRGVKTLVVDLDPQASLTVSLLPPDESADRLLAEGVHLSDCLLSSGGTVSLERVIIETAVVNLDLIPADARLSEFERASEAVLFRLRRLVRTIEGSYEVVLFDTPPSACRLQFEALRTADWVLVPVTSAGLGVEALITLREMIEAVKETNEGLRYAGVVLNLDKPRRRSREQVVRYIAEAVPEFGGFYRETLRDLREYADAAGILRLPVAIAWPRSEAARAMERLTEEFCARVGVRLAAPVATTTVAA